MSSEGYREFYILLFLGESKNEYERIMFKKCHMNIEEWYQVEVVNYYMYYQSTHINLYLADR